MGSPTESAEAEFQPFFQNRVRFAETDQQGIVFYGEYFTFQDETVSQFFREIGYGYERMAADGWQTHVANTELNYRDAAEFGDVLVNELRVVEMGSASFTFEYRVKRNADGGLLADGMVTHVAVDLETEETRPVPDAFREAVAAFQGGLETDG
ncbi:YbgC/FadM family acyl-CoA thioesterase [Natronorubrum sp. JWXQ-INN-674]|uniref:YbgC/FadM family acyl-CoA thioesterase n=1 Tax=Natronorubrum halalkaliphilum TaxID=2691917 RepID=A0A6B0VJT1_9EURY|nr:thioesterase family protein [Natronorubrum halalkaliphilum]MXV61072.1 YbgC/FadM family acyl-CoA thioesterase [Natronorubrum halalkaliphilum]